VSFCWCLVGARWGADGEAAELILGGGTVKGGVFV
jgi:hypothetical protein